MAASVVVLVGEQIIGFVTFKFMLLIRCTQSSLSRCQGCWTWPRLPLRAECEYKCCVEYIWLMVSQAYGEAGVVHLVRILQREIKFSMMSLGVRSIDQLSPEMVSYSNTKRDFPLRGQLRLSVWIGNPLYLPSYESRGVCILPLCQPNHTLLYDCSSHLWACNCAAFKFVC